MSDFQFVQIPIPAQTPQPQTQSRRLLPPVRIRVALEYLRFAAMKPARGAVVGPHAVEVIPGQELSRAEANARESAANLLNDYFNGKMEADPWEKGELDSDRSRSQRLMGGQPGSILTCIACGTSPRSHCPFCKGSGEVIMFPNKVTGGDE